MAPISHNKKAVTAVIVGHSLLATFYLHSYSSKPMYGKKYCKQFTLLVPKNILKKITYRAHAMMLRKPSLYLHNFQREMSRPQNETLEKNSSLSLDVNAGNCTFPVKRLCKYHSDCSFREDVTMCGVYRSHSTAAHVS